MLSEDLKSLCTLQPQRFLSYSCLR